MRNPYENNLVCTTDHQKCGGALMNWIYTAATYLRGRTSQPFCNVYQYTDLGIAVFLHLRKFGIIGVEKLANEQKQKQTKEWAKKKEIEASVQVTQAS